MRCYLPSTGTILIVIVIGAALLHGPVSHVAAGMGTIAIILALTALVAGVFTGTILATRAIQRRRATAGGCVTCRFQCQRAQTTCQPASVAGRGGGRRPLLVGVYNREPEPPRWPHASAMDGSAGSGNGSVPGTAQDQDRARANSDLIPT